MAAAATNDVWAVGWKNDANLEPHTLTEHWDGTSWSVVSSPDGGSYQNVLYGVAAVGAGDVWAVGKYTVGGSYSHTLVEHFSSASCTTPVPTPTSTPTSLPTATPTPCTGFSDVQPGSTFYPYVTCLVNHGIVSGYPDAPSFPTILSPEGSWRSSSVTPPTTRTLSHKASRHSPMCPSLTHSGCS